MNIKTLYSGIMVAAVFALASNVSASEAFAEPAYSKAGAGGAYLLTAFVDQSEDGLSFVLELPSGAKKVSVSNCGFSRSPVVARCYFEPTTGRLAVALLRLDGQALENGEYKLGSVAFDAPGRMKLEPLQVANVTSAHRSVGGAIRQSPSSTNAER